MVQIAVDRISVLYPVEFGMNSLNIPNEIVILIKPGKIIMPSIMKMGTKLFRFENKEACKK